MSLLVIGAIIIGLSYMKGSKLLTNKLTILGRYNEVMGLLRGNPVMMHGVSIGKVASLSLGKDGVVTVEFEIDPYRDIPVDSYAEIYSADLLGAKAVRFVPGKSSEYMEDEAQIKTGLEVSTFDKAGQFLQNEGASLADSVRLITHQLNQLTGSVNRILNGGGSNDLEQILRNLNTASASLNRMTAKLEPAMGNMQQLAQNADKVVGNLSQQNQKIDASLSNVKTLTDSLAASSHALRALARDAGSAAAGLDVSLGQLRSPDNSLGLLLNDRALYDDAAGTLQSLKDLLKAIEKNPQRYLDVDVYVFERKKKAAATE